MADKINHNISDGIEYKLCTKCDKWKPLSEFSIDTAKWDNLHNKCKDCEKDYRNDNKDRAHQYYLDNREKLIEYSKQYKKNKK